MNNTKKISLRRIAVLLIVIAISLSLFSCDMGKKPSDAPTTQNPLITTPIVDYTFDKEEMNAFLSLVDYNKLLQVEEIFASLYVGEYKEYSEISADVIKFIVQNVDIGDIETVDDATTVFIDSYLHVMGDKYAYYYDADAYEDYKDDMNGEYAGIGVQVTMNEDKYIDILMVFEDSPADRVGILPGDVLVEVGGEDIAKIGYYETIDKVRGELGTSVNITVMRDGERITFDVIREKVIEQTIDFEMMPDNIGYIRITGFDGKTYGQFVDAYTSLDSMGAKGLIFDLRNNPGGSLDSVVAILEYILPDGPIVHMEYKDETHNYTISSVDDCSWSFRIFNEYYENHQINLPMAVITNQNTASAGELFTSTLNDYNAATLIGVKTYGKGVGQTSVPLTDVNGKEDGSVVTITYFHYAPPYSPNYDGIGITPDIEVELSEEAQNKNIYKLTYEEDTQLQAGIEEINRIIRIMNTLGN